MERRFSDRVPTEVGVSCRVPASPEQARLVDLSRSGCRLEFVRRRIAPGATVNLDFRAGNPVAGEVVWTDGEHAGVRFHSTLPKQVAIEFGLEEPEPQPEALARTASRDPRVPVEGLLRHWVRRLTDAFAG